MLLAFEVLFFYTSYRREIAPYLANDFDQAGYLQTSYELQEAVLKNGLGALVREACQPGHPTGMAFPIEGAFLGVLLGGTRFPRLLLNFLTFCTLELSTFYLIRRHWNRRYLAYMGVGLILCQSTTWNVPGGWFDFRIDFLAYCLYGVWTVLVLRSDIFAERSWAVCGGLVGAVLVINRFFTAAYLLGVSSGIVLCCLLSIALRAATGKAAHVMWRRLWNVGLSQGITIAAPAPFLILNRRAIYSYYVVGHLIGQEKYVRAQEFHLTGWISHLLYYPRSLVADQLGSWFTGVGILLALCVALMLFVRRPGPNAVYPGSANRCAWLELTFLLGAFAGPLILLTLDVSKSPVVGGVVGVPAALLLLAGWVCLVEGHQSKGFYSPPARALGVIAGILVCAAGFVNQLAHATRHLRSYPLAEDLKRATDLDAWMARYAFDQGWRRPGFSTDVILPWFITQVISTCGYERAHLLVLPRALLGGVDIMGVDRASALELVSKSDFVLLTTLPKEGVYPFYAKVAQYWPALKSWADQHLLLVRELAFSNFVAMVYCKPRVQLIGLSGDWITSEGLVIRAESSVFKQFPVISLSGEANYSWLPKQPSAQAILDTPDDAREFPASFHKDGNRWELTVDLRGRPLPPSGEASVRVKFDTFFVPRDLGINNDTRQLVVEAPINVEFSR